MKFFHLSDLHIGVKLGEVSLIEDQREVFDQICTYAKAEKPQAIVIAGDIYDKKDPSPEAVALFDEFITRLYNEVPDAELMLISGNHDNPFRTNVFRSILEAHRLHMIGRPPQDPDEYIERVTLTDEYGPVNFLLLPFVNPAMIRRITGETESGKILSYDEALHILLNREELDPSERNVLVSHQFYLASGKQAQDMERMESEMTTVGNVDKVDADVLLRFDYSALGHLHKPIEVSGPCHRYCGTPMPYSLSESGQDKGIVVVEMKEKGNVDASRVLPLKTRYPIRDITGPLSVILANPSGDRVRIRYTKDIEEGEMDIQDRLRHAFPRMIRGYAIDEETGADDGSENPTGTETVAAGSDPSERNVIDLCMDFLKTVDDEEKLLLDEMIELIKDEDTTGEVKDNATD